MRRSSKSVLKLAEIPSPPLAPGEALVRVVLSPISPSDLHMVRGRYGYQPELPASPGIEGVGIVEAVAPGVQGMTVGTRVVFIGTWNTWREQIVCPVDRLVPVPDGLDDQAAATCSAVRHLCIGQEYIYLTRYVRRQEGAAAYRQTALYVPLRLALRLAR